MSTIEKLMVQIFERKNSIIEQVKHQVELYDQQLASKLVIQGIDPPSWLWNHEAPSHSSDPSEIHKQRLISELLLPLPQQAVPYFNNFNFNTISIPECNFDQQDEPLKPTCFDDFHNVPDIATEVQPAASSPQQQVATRLDDGNSGLPLSRTEFKRSKSRQKALELRSSAKSGAKSHEQDGNISVVSYRNGTPFMDEFLKSNDLEKPDSDKCLYTQLDGSPKSEGVNTSCLVEHKAREGYGSIGSPTDNAGSRTKLVGTVFCEQVNKPMQPEDLLNVPQEEDAGSEGIKIQSCNVNNSSGSMRLKHLHHGESDGRVCKRESYGSETSGKINKSTRFSDNLGIFCEGDAESEGINIRWSEQNTCEEIPNRQLEQVCDSTVKPARFQETSYIQLGVTESTSGNIFYSIEDGASVAMPSPQFKHEMDSSELDICFPRKIVDVESGMQIDESSPEEIPLVVAHGNCCTDSTPDVNKLSTTGENFLPSRISCSQTSSKKLPDMAPSLCAANKDNEKGYAVSFSSLQDHPSVLESLDLMTPLIIGERNSGMMKVQTEGHSSRDTTPRKLSANPVKSEIPLRKNPELARNFPVVENDDGTGELLKSCSLSKSHEHVLRSVQPLSPAVNIANTEKESDNCATKNSLKTSGVNPKLRTSSCGLEGGNSLLEELNALNTEVEVPQMLSAAVEQSKLQKKDATSTAWDYAVLNGVVLDQENLHRVQSVSCYGTSKANEESYHFQDNILVKENSESEATTLSFGMTEGDVEIEALMLLPPEAKQATDDTLMIDEGHKSFLEGNPLSLDVEAKINKEYCDRETFLIESTLRRESCAGAFEENAFMNAEYDGMMEDDQCMPVLERFVMETDDEESSFAGGRIEIEESSSTLRRASVLERLCKSSSRNSPVSEFPMTFGLHKTSDLFQSVPTGLMEHISLVGDCINVKLQQKSYSAGLPVSTDPFSFNVSTPYASPYKKKWDHSTSSSGPKSHGSLNPELVCFTIEEDPGNCYEIGNDDEAAEAPTSHSSCLRSSLKRKPLADITEDGSNPHLSVSVNNNNVLEAGQTPKFCFRSQLDSTGTEANVTGAQIRARQKLGDKLSNKKRRLNDTKENRNVSVGANGVKQVTETVKKAKLQKPKHSENQKTITGVSDLQKVTRSNNIVSNMSSFIPLVQQKKAAAAVATGKRDVKVKALEAAEAAKRLAEKKENERKAKKEAWKAEKARLEQENLFQLELKKKKKEEELKKKEADVAARKRIREDEEKKEKEGKRRRVEEARKQQHEHGKKQADKLIRHHADGLRMHEKDPNNGLEHCTKTETGGRKGGVITESEDKSTTMSCNTSTKICDPKEVRDLGATAEKNPKDVPEGLQSYDISPYEGSDDDYEDEDDENDKRKEKFVPAWASKNNLAEVIFYQQHISPDEILPPESFCSITEVLVPRKQPVK